MGGGEYVPNMTAIHILNAGIHKFHTHIDRQTTADKGRQNGEDQIHGTNIFVVR